MSGLYRWPRTAHGWRTLFWLWLGRCPIHHTRMNVDSPIYDPQQRVAYCFKCSGIGIWPGSAREALWQNARASDPRPLTMPADEVRS